jgi:hypothetical protein
MSPLRSSAVALHVLLVSAVVFIHVSSVTISVPCGRSNTVGPDIAANTTLMLSGCDSSPNGTALQVKLNATSGARSGLFIVVQHSNRVYVTVQSLHGRVNVTNLHVVFRNITNDVDNRSTPITSAMFRIADCADVVNTSVSVVDVHHARNTSLVRLNYVNRVDGLSLIVANVSSQSTYPVVFFDTIVSGVVDSAVVIANVSYHSMKSLSQSSIIQVGWVSLPVISVRRTSMSLVDCTLGGTGSSVFAIVLSDARVDDQSHIMVTGLIVEVAVASIAGGLLMLNTNVNRTLASVVNFTCASPRVIVEVVLVQNSTVVDSVIVIDTAWISGAETTVIGLYLMSSQVTASSIDVAHVTLTEAPSGAALYLVLAAYVASIPSPATLSSTRVTVSNCHITSEEAVILFVSNVSLLDTGMWMSSVATSVISQYIPVILSNFPRPAVGITLSIQDSYLVGAFPVRLELLTIVNSSVVVTSSTLHAAQSVYFSSATCALMLYGTQLTNTHITVSSTNAIGVPSGANAGPLVMITFSTLQSVGASLVLTSVTTSGGMLSLISSTLQQSTMVSLQVIENVSVPPALLFSLVDVSASTVSGGSAAHVLLPRDVRIADNGTSQRSLLSLDRVTVTGHSVFSISGGGCSSMPGAVSSVLWPNRTLSVSASFVSDDSNISLAGLNVTAAGIASDEIILLDLTTSVLGARLLRLQMSHCTFVGGQHNVLAEDSPREFVSLIVPSAPSSGGASESPADAAIILLNCTFVVPWASFAPSRLILVHGGTATAAALSNCSLALVADQLLLYGLTSVVDAKPRAAAQQNATVPSQLSASVVLRCSWWGRHPFTSPLSPIHVALHGKLLRGPNSAVGSSTPVAFSPISFLTPVPPQCEMPWGDNGNGDGSWSASASDATHSRSRMRSLTQRQESVTSSATASVSSNTLSRSASAGDQSHCHVSC